MSLHVTLPKASHVGTADVRDVKTEIRWGHYWHCVCRPMLCYVASSWDYKAIGWNVSPNGLWRGVMPGFCELGDELSFAAAAAVACLVRKSPHDLVRLAQ